MTTVRRAFLYIVTLITLGLFAAGVWNLLALALELAIRGPAGLSVAGQGFVQQRLSLGLAMLLIGGPLWFFFWRAVMRNVAANPGEVGAALRKLFLAVIMAASALTGMFAAKDLLKWLMAGVPSTQSGATFIATLVVTAAVWYYHWRVSETEGQPTPAAKTLRRWYVYLLAAWALVWLTAGLGQIINSSLLFLPVWGGTLAAGTFWSDIFRNHIAWVVLGGPVWAYHWFRMAGGDIDSNLRQIYLHLIATLGGTIAALVGVSVSLYQFLVWALGGAGNSPNYFQFLAWTIPTVVIAGAVWAYHQQVADEEAAQVQIRRLSARRIRLYIMSFVGLGTLVAGLIILFGVLVNLWISAAGGDVATTRDWWRSQLALAIALLAVGTPLWLYYWNKVIKMAAAGGPVEWGARSRRVYLYVIVGVTIIALAGGLINLIYLLLNALLQAGSGLQVLRDARWSLQTLAVAAAVLAYHWRILREDQRRGAERAAARKAVTVIAGDQDAGFVSRLEAKLGYRLHVLRYLGPAAETALAFTDADLDRLVAEISEAPGGKVMVLVTGERPIVAPYQEK